MVTDPAGGEPTLADLGLLLKATVEKLELAEMRESRAASENPDPQSVEAATEQACSEFRWLFQKARELARRLLEAGHNLLVAEAANCLQQFEAKADQWTITDEKTGETTLMMGPVEDYIHRNREQIDKLADLSRRLGGGSGVAVVGQQPRAATTKSDNHVADRFVKVGVHSNSLSQGSEHSVEDEHWTLLYDGKPLTEEKMKLAERHLGPFPDSLLELAKLIGDLDKNASSSVRDHVTIEKQLLKVHLATTRLRPKIELVIGTDQADDFTNEMGTTLRFWKAGPDGNYYDDGNLTVGTWLGRNGKAEGIARRLEQWHRTILLLTKAERRAAEQSREQAAELQPGQSSKSIREPEVTEQKDIWEDIPPDLKNAIQDFWKESKAKRSEGKRLKIKEFCRKRSLDEQTFKSEKDRVEKRKRRLEQADE